MADHKRTLAVPGLEPTSGRRRRGRPSSGRAWAALRAEVAAALPAACGWCGVDIDPAEPWHLDHITPVAAGGTDTRDNVQPLHAACNRAKGAQHAPPRPRPALPSRDW